MVWSSSSSASSASSSPRNVHPASQVDPATHSQALIDLLELDISREVIEYVVDSVVETVDFAMGRKPASPSSRGKTVTRRPEHTKFIAFVTNVLTRAEVTTPTLLAALVYIDRAKPHLHIGLEQWALERVFLGSIIVASKYLNDSTLKNIHWALCTGVFGKRDVGRIEREYLEVLNFELGISEADLLSHHQGLLDAIIYLPPSAPRFTQHNSPRSHSKGRNHLDVPELDPSNPLSPHSSCSSSYSSSPYTPCTVDSSPPRPRKGEQMSKSAPRKLITAAQFQASTMDLLRSFPIPRLTTSS